MNDLFTPPENPGPLLASVLESVADNPLYLPPCPCCSSFAPGLLEPIIRGPALFPNRHNATVRLLRCCRLSEHDRFENASAAIVWWRDARLNRPVDADLQARRESTLQRLREGHYEPL